MSDAQPLPLRDDLRGLRPYGAPQLDVSVRLNVNENPYPPDEGAVRDIVAAVAGVAGSLNRYPDRDATALRADLAGYLGHGLTDANVWAANGSNEVMVQLLQAFGGPGRRALSFGPTYSMYPQYCRDTFTTYVEVDRRADFTIDPDDAVGAVMGHRPSVVLVASPNNPTGTPLALDVVGELCRAVPGVVVVDEAYAEFAAPERPSALSLLPEFDNLVVTRTMSKAFALAGARIGYLAASPEIVDAVQLVRLPYHLSSVTQAVARAALRHADSLQHAITVLRDERAALSAWLTDQGLEVAASDANFLLFGRFANRHQVWEDLLAHSVLIRETGPDGWLRVSIGTPDDNTAFRHALDTVYLAEREHTA